MRDTLSVDTERFFSSVSLSKKNGMVYMIFKGKESEKELSVPAAFGLLFLYEHFSVVNTNGASNDWKDAYAKDKNAKKTFAVFDFCSTCTNAYLVSVNHVRAAPPPDA